MRNTVWLWGELLAIYVAVPVLMYERVLPNWPIPFLLVAAIWALVVLWRDATFERRRLISFARIQQELWRLLLRDIPLLVLLGLAVQLFAPEMLFSLIRRTPAVWLAVIFFYPIFSVYPQEVLYRAFFFHRYKPLFGDGAGMIAVSAAVFGLAHIIFVNWVAIALTAIGGLLFGWTYRKSGSLALTCFEHAVFGDFIFTIGIGQFFYHLARR
ncbi:MAG TPA: CPBP family intramembrane glutamic endopeptidase [Candidatus Acidoferrum sp.]|nr:CPBP family intramembrane glutamic endopeptidase [Candidatus Acidoferrum sp.]